MPGAYSADLEIDRVLGWYRIPLRTAPKVVAVDHLAFYQPASFGEAGGRINSTAPVRGHELTTRGELIKDEADHPRPAEEYYRIQLGSLESLPQPILAEKWRRITFLYTTGEYLLRARTLRELVVESDERALLWRSLRERAGNAQQYVGELPGLDVPAEVLLVLLGVSIWRFAYFDPTTHNDIPGIGYFVVAFPYSLIALLFFTIRCAILLRRPRNDDSKNA